MDFNPHLPYGRWLYTPYVTPEEYDFNPHLPYGRWHYKVGRPFPPADFNPHLPCGRWLTDKDDMNWYQAFQSTPSLRKVTSMYPSGECHILISIHTFLTEGDVDRAFSWFPAHSYFNPHLPYGRWHRPQKNVFGSKISIHTFLTEGDVIYLLMWNHFWKFQSTPSLRKVTTVTCFWLTNVNHISIHTFLTEGDALLLGRCLMLSRFQSTPSLRKVTL